MNRNRIIILSLSFPLLLFSFCNIYAQQNQPLIAENITLFDPNLKIELVASGLDFPTTMAFLGPDDFLILEKAGTVKRVTNGVILDKPLLQVDVSVKDERGLLGIAINEKKNLNDNGTSIKNDNISYNVFLYYVVCKEKNTGCENTI
jgi:glucose/arabinose dehydrogenase